MKNFYFLSLTLILSTLACEASELPGYVDFANPTASNPPAQLMAPIPQEPVKPEVTATPALDYQAMFESAQATSMSAEKAAMEANIALIQITANSDQLHTLETVSANNVIIAQEESKQESIRASETAFQTSFPATQTQQIKNDTLTPAAMTQASSNLTATNEYPTQLYAAVNAQNSADSWWLDFGVRIFALLSMGVFMFGLGTFLIRKPAILAAQSAQADRAILDKNGLKPIPMVVDKDNENSTLLAAIHCTEAQLFQLAEGIVIEGKSLAFGQWQGKDVHKVLHLIRHALIRTKTVKELEGKGGELDHTTKEGREFFAHVYHNHGVPPPPFECVG